MNDNKNNELEKFSGLEVLEDPNSLLGQANLSTITSASLEEALSAGKSALQQAIDQAKERLKEADASNWSYEISPDEVEALLNRLPFLQITNADLEVEYEREVTFIRSKSGWLMHDYWDALAASPGEHMYNLDMIDADDEDGSGRSGVGMPPGVGTIIKQAFDTAEQMVALAKQRNWKAVYIVDGHRRMKWATWVAAQAAGIEVIGFEPNEKERDRLYRLRRNEEAIDKLRIGMRASR